MALAIRQLEEKNVACEINCMNWSDRMDLVALSNVKGEVALHRLTWTRAWSFGPPKEGVGVKGLAWKPDGKIIAIAYSSGEILLVSVENKVVLNSSIIESDITCIYWVREKEETKKDVRHPCEEEEQKDYIKYIDLSSVFLPDPPSVSSIGGASSSSDDHKKPNLMYEQPDLNLLVIGTRDGFLHLLIFGCFTCGVLNVNEYINIQCSVEDVQLTEDLSKIFVTVRDIENNIRIVLISSQIFRTHAKELFAVAIKYVKLHDLDKYLSNTITTITETWESILLEMDNKLSKYAGKVAEGGVTADFLDLLMFGICSGEMEEFLIHDLTKKGLEKFGQTIEMSYSNIQKLLMKNTTKFGQNITYHLAELRGLARFEYRYKTLGLSEDDITAAILSNGAFLIKTGEMQQIINHSINNYKAFFRWLYTAIMHLMDEPIPSEIPKMTQQDLAYITEFLQNFDHIGHKNDVSKSSGFIMERLGQYLADSPLTIPPNMEGNEWTKFLEKNDCVQAHSSIFKHYSNLSLIQQFKDLTVGLKNIFESPKFAITKQFKHLYAFNCFNFAETSIRMSSINLNKDGVLFAFMEPSDRLFLLQIEQNCKTSAKCGKFYFGRFLSNDSICDGFYQILDGKFYNTNILSLLFQDAVTKTGILYQFPVLSALEQLSEVNINNEIEEGNVIRECSGSELTPKLFKVIEGMVPSNFAVSGSRRVGIVLSENKRKIKLYEMEGEEEEDEDADMTSSLMRESDVSMQDNSLI